MKKHNFLRNFAYFSFPVNLCIYINTEYWPEHSFNNEAIPDISDTESCLFSKRKENKDKPRPLE